MQIVCYAGGTCGDLVCAMIDPMHAYLDNNVIRHAPERSKLKKPHLFDSDTSKHLYMKSLCLLYASLPSHDLDYHVRHAHDFIGVTVKDPATALWAAERFKALHRPSVWQEMQAVCGASSTHDYAQVLIDYADMIMNKTNKVLTLERILSGHAAQDLSLLLEKEVHRDLYDQWLTKQ